MDSALDVIKIISGGGFTAVGAFLVFWMFKMEKSVSERLGKLETVMRDQLVNKDTCDKNCERIAKIEEKYDNAIVILRIIEDRLNRGLVK